MKKIISVVLSVLVISTALSACGKKSEGFDASNDITVISREDGSGTRSAFTELFEILEKDASGKKVDKTIDSATVTQSTGVMLTNVADNQYAVGYVSLGSMNDTVKALKIDGTEATADNIKNGSYKISRPFNIATKGKISDAAQDFINYIMSEDGQKIVEKNGYISKENKGKFTSSNPKGKIKIAGSSSVTPVMEKLVEAYNKVNPDVQIELNQSDSTNGMTSVIDGIADIGMASRELKDSEISKGLNHMAIALDGIAVVVNKKNTNDELTSAKVKEIYTGKVTKWSDIK